jgi:hypothetical protein
MAKLKREIITKDYKAEYNDDLEGYVIHFLQTDHFAQTQFEEETNKLHADYGKKYLVRYKDYDDNLSSEEEKQVEDFVTDINKILLIGL